jgi:hypothetical protein
MTGDPRERWQQLCEQAAKEPNAAKLLAMVREINELIDARYTAGAGSACIPRNTGAGSTSTPPKTDSSTACGPRDIRLASSEIQAVTRPSSTEPQCGGK